SASTGSIWFLANYKWWSEGKNLVDKQGDSFVVGLDQKDVVDAMNYFKRFLDDGEIPKSLLGVSDWSDPAIVAGLTQGTAAMGFMPPATFRQILSIYAKANPGKPIPLKSGLAPGINGPSISLYGGRSLGINANTKHPAEAWKLLKFLNSQQVFT